jgi:magnesium chelatase subunit I
VARGQEPEASPEPPERSAEYDRIVSWFSGGKRVEISDTMPDSEYAAALRRVEGLADVARRHLPVQDERDLPGVMELVLEGLYQNSFVARETVGHSTFYSDMLMRMFDGMKEE